MYEMFIFFGFVLIFSLLPGQIIVTLKKRIIYVIKCFKRKEGVYTLNKVFKTVKSVFSKIYFDVQCIDLPLCSTVEYCSEYQVLYF